MNINEISEKLQTIYELTNELSSEVLTIKENYAIKKMLIALDYTTYAIKSIIDELPF